LKKAGLSSTKETNGEKKFVASPVKAEGEREGKGGGMDGTDELRPE